MSGRDDKKRSAAFDASQAWLIRPPRQGSYSTSLAAGIAILRCFTREQPTLGTAEIAGKLGIARSSTQRYLSTLVRLGYLERVSMEQVSPRHQYRLAARAANAGISALNSVAFRDQAWPLLVRLRRETTFAISLAVLDRYDVVIVHHARSFSRGQTPIETPLASGVRIPAHCTAMGKVLLADALAHERHQSLPQQALPMMTSATMTFSACLSKHLDKVAVAGYAIDNEMSEVGGLSLAVPVRVEPKATVASLAVTIYRIDFDPDRLADFYLRRLMKAANELAALIRS